MQERVLSLSTPLTVLKGIGPKKAEALTIDGLSTIDQLLHYYPRKYLDRTTLTLLSKLSRGQNVNVIGTIQSIKMRKGKFKYFLESIIYDGYGYLTLRWFNGAKYIKKALKIGDKLAVSGKVEFYNGYQIIHPDFEKLKEDEDPINTGSIIPIYPLTSNLKNNGIDSRFLRRIIKTIKKSSISINDHFEKNFLIETNLIELKRALNDIHFAKSSIELKRAIERLKFDEHFFLQLYLVFKNQKNLKIKSKPCFQNSKFDKKIIEALSFELTEAQHRAHTQIKNSLTNSSPMNCLLQGDVGSGKTIVSILASSIAVESNFQVAIMAPTEILARQHLKSFKKEFDPLNITCALLTGGMAKKDRDKIIDSLNNGKINLVIGTHALIQKDVKFKKLGLVIIDEQHRFGVNQRRKLVEKGNNPHFLAMTATPIPRTLAITLYGDMDLCIIDEMPKNRKPVITKVIDENRLKRVYDFMAKEVVLGRQCMIVYPLVEETEKSDLIAATEMYEELSKNEFSNLEVGLIHGKMEKTEKDSIMNNFSANNINILISTTVIEVGIDVPNSTIMLIEHAERFGLTQLHQLRGRVGRGKNKSFCILVRRSFSENAKKRLNIMEETNDGFVIADEDLKIRGPGEFFGIRQSGYLSFKIANMKTDGSLIQKARKLAKEIIKHDSNLEGRKNIELKNKLYKTYKQNLNEKIIS